MYFVILKNIVLIWYFISEKEFIILIYKKKERFERFCISKIRLKVVYKRKWYIEFYFRKW